MSVVINTNTAATVANNNLSASNALLQRSLNRLSSGLKIVQPSDDAGGLAVSMKLEAAMKRTDAVNTNVANAISFLQTQDGGLKTAGKVINRISELKTLKDDVTKSASDKLNYEVYIEIQNFSEDVGYVLSKFIFGTKINVNSSDNDSVNILKNFDFSLRNFYKKKLLD